MAKQNILERNKMKKAKRLMEKGQFEETAHLLMPLCKANSRNTEAWMMLASACGQNGDLNTVIDSCQHVLSLEPTHPQANSLLGNALASLGRHEEALSHYRKALESRPNDPGILNNLGNALYLSGNLEQAAEILNRVVRIRPDYADAYHNLGNIYKALNRIDESCRFYTQAIELNPNLFEALLDLGNLLSYRIGNPGKAEKCYRQALRLKPESFDAHYGLSFVFRFKGQLDEALKSIRDGALRARPGDPGTLAFEAEILDLKGCHEEAYRKASALISGGANNPMAAVVMTRLCQHNDTCDETINYAEQLLDAGSLSDTRRRELHFALGKLYDKLGMFDEAFTHFTKGNNLHNAPFDAAAKQRDIDNLIASFSKEAMAALPRASTHNRSYRPVFIVGMPRSGTSLTEQILASHSHVYGAGELSDITDIAATLPEQLRCKKPFPACVSNLTQTRIDKLAKQYLDRLACFSTNALRVTDKMPHNFMYLGLISLLFPNSKVIHCIRDPRDTCLSIYTQDFGWAHAYANNLEHLGASYLDYQRLMKYWESVLEIPIMTVSYEEMVTEQESVSRSLVNFIGLEWDENCLQFDKSGRFVSTASYEQVRQPIYRKSMGRWKNYEKHLGPLIEILKGSIETPEN